MTDSMPATAVPEADVIIVGAGFAGLYLLYRLRERGFRAIIVEAGDDVGGTWYWNRYPGARCDVFSHEYQLAFPEFLNREWVWSERFSPQEEIEAYLRFVADRLDLRRDILFGERVRAARFDAAAVRWTVETERGTRLAARFCVMATGCLSVANLPDIPGLDDFAGEIVHTAAWPAEGRDLSGRHVAVIGTGSSGVQVIPQIAAVASQLTVFQRTPNYVIPVANAVLDAERLADERERFPGQRDVARRHPSGFTAASNPRKAAEMSEAEREAELEARWAMGTGFPLLGAWSDLTVDETANVHAAEFYRRKIRAIVPDPTLQAKLIPTNYPFGAKRLCLGINYFETFLRPNVALVDLRATPITRITANAIETSQAAIPIDTIVFATGFDAITGALTRITIEGPEGTLADKWASGVRAYLGLAIAGFPNLFVVTGPGSPSVLSNVIVSIEQHVDWIADCLVYLRERGLRMIEADEAREQAWAAHVTETGRAKLFHAVSSWYMGDNIPGKPRNLLPYCGGVPAYREACDRVAANDYEGFALAR